MSASIYDLIPSTEAEKCLGVEPFRQPSERRNPGGDCFACATFAAVRHLVPETVETFDTVWKAYEFEYEPNPNVIPAPESPRTYLENHWGGYPKALGRLKERNPIEFQMEFVPLDFNLERFYPSWFRGYNTSWKNALFARIDAGSILMGSIALEPVQPDSRDFKLTDHVILLDGYRRAWRDHPRVAGCREMITEFHVVCSAKGAYWIEDDVLIWKHGFSAWIAISRNLKGTLL